MSFFALKTIALLSMLYDHAANVWPCVTGGALPLPLQHAVHYLGRIAAPIFLFSIANGYRHTRSVRRYALRLLVFACLAEYPYYLLFEAHGNILFTLLLGLVTLHLLETLNRRHRNLGYLAAGTVVVLAELLALSEGKGRYLLFILVFYLTDAWPRRKKLLLWLLLLPLGRYAFTWDILTQAAAGTLALRWFQLWALNAMGPILGVILTFFYNGRRGPAFPGDKYIWYIAYPAHLLLFGLLRP